MFFWFSHILETKSLSIFFFFLMEVGVEVLMVLLHSKGFPGSVSKSVKSLTKTVESRVLSLGQGNPLEKEKATPSSILALEIPWTEEPGRLQSMELQE